MDVRKTVAPDSEESSAAPGASPEKTDVPSSALPVPKVARTRRVLLLTSSLASMASMSGLVEVMCARGHSVICCAPEFDERYTKIFSRLGAEVRAVEVPAFSLSAGGLKRAAQRFKETLEELKPELVITYMQDDGPTAAAMAALANAGHTAQIVGGLNEVLLEPIRIQRLMDWPRRRVILSLHKKALHASEAVVFQNRDDQKLFKTLGLAPKGARAASVNGPGADLDDMREAALPALDKGAIFLMAADLAEIHGVRDYCEAARLLQAKAPNARCILIGAQPKSGKAMALKELRGYRGPIHYIGPREDLRPYVERCHVFVAPSRGGGVTPGLMMALAAGRPIITTATRGCRHVVADGVNGVVAPPQNPEALANAMAQILKRPDLLPGMASASRSRAKRYFDATAINEIMLEALGL